MFTTNDREAAYNHFSTLVATIPEDALEPWHYDAEIIRVNAQRCLAAIDPFLDDVAKTMGNVDAAEIREMPTLGLALAFADSRVFVPASDREIKNVQDRQRPKRRLAIMMLTILREIDEEKKLIADPAKVDAILPGRGAVDEAQDGVACVAVFRENAAAIAGKHPFDDAWLKGLADDSNWLLGQLKIKGAKADKAQKSPESLVRDRLYTEIVRRHGQGKKVAVEKWGWKRVDEHYPALFSRILPPPAPPPAAKPAAPPAAPVAPATPAPAKPNP